MNKCYFSTEVTNTNLTHVVLMTVGVMESSLAFAHKHSQMVRTTLSYQYLPTKNKLQCSNNWLVNGGVNLKILKFRFRGPGAVQRWVRFLN